MRFSFIGFLFFIFGVFFMYGSDPHDFNKVWCFWAYIGSFLALIDFFSRTKAWLSFSHFRCFLRMSSLTILFVGSVFFFQQISRPVFLWLVDFLDQVGVYQNQILFVVPSLSIGVFESFRFHIKSQFSLKNFKFFFNEIQYVLGLNFWVFIQLISYYTKYMLVYGYAITPYFFFH